MECVIWYTDFNPHTREGCDGRMLGTLSPLFHFNPHTREGCDAIRSHVVEE